MAYIQTKVRTLQMSEDGTQKRVSATYLVEAESFTEAETKISEIVASAGEDYTVEAVSKMNVTEIVFDPQSMGDTSFYKIKVEMVILDEVTAKEKRSAFCILVEAESVDMAIAQSIPVLAKSVSDYEIVSINKTSIKQVFTYQN